MTNSATEIRGWLSGRLPSEWFIDTVAVTVDKDEVLIEGRLAEPAVAEGADEAEQAAAGRGAIERFREQTRGTRIEIARELEYRSGKRVSWGARCGAETVLFTTASVPVMTRLRQPERQVLDTLVDAGVARSRSDALGWCVRLVGSRSETWLADLRTAMSHVEEVRQQGPGAA
jgi:hypothetical protein